MCMLTRGVSTHGCILIIQKTFLLGNLEECQCDGEVILAKR